MRLLQAIFSVLWGLSYLGNGILFLYIEWSFLRESFVQVFNPSLHLQVFGVLLTTPLFWIFLAMAVVGHYAASSIERHLEQSARRSKIDVAEVVSPASQTFQERDPNPSSSVRGEQIYSPEPPQSFQKPVSKLETESVEPQVKLLKWAIQSSQKVQFSYEKLNGEKSDRIVTPIDFKTVEQTLCLEGYCHLRSARRTFAIKRMRDIRIVSASAAKYRQVTFQEVITPYNHVQSKVSPALQSSSSEAAKPKNVDTQVKPRPYIKCHIDELERITTSGWSNTKILNEIYYELEFRSRKKALDLRERIAARLTQLQGEQFSWSATTASPGSQNLSIDAFKYEEGLLRHYGYKVGMNGLPESKRWEILDTVFLRPLLHIDNVVYLSEWGEPNSARRLQKLADSIAAFARNAKRRNKSSFNKAIQDWETDLAYLKRTYYNNRFSFQYPRT